MTDEKKVVGPFKQLLPLTGLNIKGPLSNNALDIIENAGIVIQGNRITAIGEFEELRQEHANIVELEGDFVAFPGMIDAHTHLCFSGSRHMDYAARNAGATYLEIAAAGGGIWDTVQKTRAASFEQLYEESRKRLDLLLERGVTTVEIKSGYGLNIEHELKQLRVIKKLNENHLIDIIPTCLAAHIKPLDFKGSSEAYLQHVVVDLMPMLQKEELCRRVDIFIEESTFPVHLSRKFLLQAKNRGFEITIHGDQFTVGGAELGVEIGALSVDHLEASDAKAIASIAASEVVATVLPGASLGLGMQFAPARKLLDAGATMCIASDWNPGSAPMGCLLTQASILAASEKLTDAEVWSAMTHRAAKALNLKDRGTISVGMLADFIAFPASDYREILYHQGELKPSHVWKKGIKFGKGD